MIKEEKTREENQGFREGKESGENYEVRPYFITGPKLLFILWSSSEITKKPFSPKFLLLQISQ